MSRALRKSADITASVLLSVLERSIVSQREYVLHRSSLCWRSFIFANYEIYIFLHGIFKVVFISFFIYEICDSSLITDMHTSETFPGRTNIGNPEQKIWNIVKKSNKIGQDQNSSISTFFA